MTLSEQMPTLVFSEGADLRIQQAAVALSKLELAHIVLVGKQEEIIACANDNKLCLDAMTLLDPSQASCAKEFAIYLCDYRGIKQLKVAQRMIQKNLFFAATLVARNSNHILIAGAQATTKKVLEAASLCIGYEPGVSAPSSYFLMYLPGKPEPLVLADCAVAVNPDASELAQIAISTARSAAQHLREIRIAMLSFSSFGSGSHTSVDKVRAATELAKALAPHLSISGEIQADAALSESIAANKAPAEDPVAGRANVLIFPDLNAGNIAYKLLQELANAQAIGPILQGFSNPVADLSRGATSADIIEIAKLMLQLQTNNRIEQP